MSVLWLKMIKTNHKLNKIYKIPAERVLKVEDRGVCVGEGGWGGVGV